MNAKIQSEFETIREADHGILYPASVVAFARDPETALHSHFEWDNSKAAEQHRLWQARQLISVCVTVLDSPGGEIEIHPYVSLESDRRGRGGYRLLVDVLTDDKYRTELVQQAMNEMAAFREKYRAFKELGSVISAMNTAEKRIAKALEK
jgi:hypothetical protein